MGADFAQQTLAHARAFFEACPRKTSWTQSQNAEVQSSEAAARVISRLPALQHYASPGTCTPGNDEALHHARILRVVGSITRLSLTPASSIAALSGIDTQTAEAVASFFSVAQK